VFAYDFGRTRCGVIICTHTHKERFIKRILRAHSQAKETEQESKKAKDANGPEKRLKAHAAGFLPKK
jgi:hypothetical protein